MVARVSMLRRARYWALALSASLALTSFGCYATTEPQGVDEFCFARMTSPRSCSETCYAAEARAAEVCQVVADTGLLTFAEEHEAALSCGRGCPDGLSCSGRRPILECGCSLDCLRLRSREYQQAWADYVACMDSELGDACY